MYKKTLTYTNQSEEEVTVDLYFHLEEYEIVKLELGEKGGLYQALQEIIASEDGTAIINQLEKILLMAYGKKTPDGGFDKSEEINRQFKSSGAFGAYAMLIVTETEEATNFINGCVPKKLSQKANAEDNKDAPRVIDVELPDAPTVKNLQEMSKEELLEAFKKKSLG